MHACSTMSSSREKMAVFHHGASVEKGLPSCESLLSELLLRCAVWIQLCARVAAVCAAAVCAAAV